MNCKQCKLRMADAATDTLSAAALMEFEAHIRECVGCREEYARVRALLEMIDRGVMAQAAAEPLPEFVARVRRRIATQDIPSKAIWNWVVPATACAAAILALAFWQFWPRSAGPRIIQTPASNGNSLVAMKRAVPNSGIARENGATAKSHSRDEAVREVAIHKRRPMEQEPEVLVPPGQAEAVLQFAAALQSGKLDGAKLIADLKNADQPIEIKPLVIAPLESSADEDNKSSGPGSNGTQKDFVSGTPIPSLVP